MQEVSISIPLKIIINKLEKFQNFICLQNRKKHLTNIKKLRGVVKQIYSKTVIRLKRLQLGLNNIKNKIKDISSTYLQTILKDPFVPEC